MSGGLLLTAILGYTLAVALTTGVTVYRSTPLRRAASAVFVLTWLLHLAAVVVYGVGAGHVPLLNLGEFLLVLGWLVLGLHLVLWFRYRVDVAGLVLPPLAALSAVAAQRLLSGEASYSSAPKGVWFLFHTVTSTVGLAILCVAFAMSVLYLVQDRALKSQRTIRLLERLPALEHCERMGYHALLLGFLLLTLSIATGVVVNESVHDRFWIRGAKQLFPLLAWSVFAVVLAARTGLGFRGRKSAVLIIAGFALGMLTVLGITV